MADFKRVIAIKLKSIISIKKAAKSTINNSCFSVCERPSEIPFTLPPRFMAQNHGDLKNEEEKEEEVKMEAQRDILAHRGSLSVSSRSSLPLFNSTSRWLLSL